MFRRLSLLFPPRLFLIDRIRVFRTDNHQGAGVREQINKSLFTPPDPKSNWKKAGSPHSRLFFSTLCGESAPVLYFCPYRFVNALPIVS